SDYDCGNLFDMANRRNSSETRRLIQDRRLGNQGTPLPLQPKIKKITHITRNRKNKTLAIPADAAAIPPNPNTAATSAIIRKVTAQPNMISPPLIAGIAPLAIVRVF